MLSNTINNSYEKMTDLKCQQNRKFSSDTFLCQSDQETFLEPIIRKRNQQNENAIDDYNRKYAVDKKGEFIKEIQRNTLYLFKCGLEHKFYLTKRQLIADQWCNTCAKTFKNILKYAEDKNYSIINKNLEKTIYIKCQHDHIFECNYKKVHNKKCKECSKTNKQMLKEMLEEENMKFEEEQRKKQNSLLSEAKRMYLLMQNQQGRINSITLTQVMREVEDLSAKYSENYFFNQDLLLINQDHLLMHPNRSHLCASISNSDQQCLCDDNLKQGRSSWSVKGGWLGSETSDSENQTLKDNLLQSNTKEGLGNFRYCCCRCYLDDLQKQDKYLQIKELYRILIIPQNFLSRHFEDLTEEELKKEFRKSALLIHPDKNSHPNSKVAFQKLFMLFMKEIKNKK